MSDSPRFNDSDPPAARAAVGTLRDLIDDRGLEAAELESEENEAGIDHVVTWTRTTEDEEPMHRAVIVGVVTNPDALVDEYPPVVAVEHSTWKGPRDGTATEMNRGTIADIYEPQASGAASAAVRSGYHAAREVTADDLDPVPSFVFESEPDGEGSD